MILNYKKINNKTYDIKVKSTYTLTNKIKKSLSYCFQS